MKIDVTIIKQLQRNIQESNQKAFEDLYRIFFPHLLQFAMLYVHKREIAEELVNDVMVKIWEKRSTLNNIDNVETYLFVSVRNHSLNYLRKYSQLHVTVEIETGKNEIININSPEKELEWKEINYKLTMAVKELPEQCRMVFILIKEQGLRYKQVAELLEISPRTVETQLFRAIKKLGGVIDTFIEKPPSKKSGQRHIFSWLFL